MRHPSDSVAFAAHLLRQTHCVLKGRAMGGGLTRFTPGPEPDRDPTGSSPLSRSRSERSADKSSWSSRRCGQATAGSFADRSWPATSDSRTYAGTCAAKPASLSPPARPHFYGVLYVGIVQVIPRLLARFGNRRQVRRRKNHCQMNSLAAFLYFRSSCRGKNTPP